MPGRLVPELVGDRVGPVAQPRDRLGERERSALSLAEIGRVPPGRHREEALVGLARLLRLARSAVDTEAAAVDLARTQVNQLERLGWNAALVGDAVEGLNRPAERVAFVLHDLFGVSFEEIGPILGRSAVAARQLASRARRRVQGAATESSADRHRQREIVTAFLAASRDGDFGALIAVLDPEVIFRADEQAVQTGATRIGLSSETRGSEAVATFFKSRAKEARLAIVEGVAAAVWAPGGRPRAVFNFRIAGDKIVEINLVADAEALGRMSVEIVEGEGTARR